MRTKTKISTTKRKTTKTKRGATTRTVTTKRIPTAQGDEGDEDLITLHSRLAQLRDAESSDGGPGAGVPLGQPRAKDADEKKDKTDKDRDKKKEKKQPKPLRIDLDGIAQRVLAFPVSEGRFGQIAGVPGKALFTVIPVHWRAEGCPRRRGATNPAASWSAGISKNSRPRPWSTASNGLTSPATTKSSSTAPKTVCG